MKLTNKNYSSMQKIRKKNVSSLLYSFVISRIISSKEIQTKKLLEELKTFCKV